MRTILLTLHVLLAIFLVGPLVAAVNQGARGLRDGDAGGLRVLARTTTIYGWASLLVGVLGAGLIRSEWGNEIGDGWLLGSILLWLLATGLVLAVVAPLLRRAVRTAADGGATRAAVPRVAAAGGVASLCYVVIAVLMVWQPGN